MKKILLLTGVLLALTASLASAAPGLDIAWAGLTAASYCPTNTGSLTDMADPCNDNFGIHPFAMSFNAPAGLSKLVSETFLVDVQSADPVLPAWWHLEDRNDGLGIPAGCRGLDAAISAPSSFSFNTSRASGTTATCRDYWGGAQSGGTSWNPGVGGPNRTRLFGVFSRGSASAGALTAGTEYWAGTGSFDTNHSVADGTTVPPTALCDGCQMPACIVWNYLILQQPVGTPNGDIQITSPGTKGQFMTWQGGAVGGSGCPQATPTRQATWGQVKSLYR